MPLSVPLESWLHTEDGVRIRVGPAGVIAGRALGSEILLDAPEASRQHALFVALEGSVRVTALGRTAVVVDGTETRNQELADGSRVHLPGLDLTLSIEPRQEGPNTWVAQVAGTTLSITARGLLIGGDGDIAAEGWNGLRLRASPAHVAASSPAPFIRNGVEIPPGTVTRCRPGDLLAPVGGGADVVIDEVDAESAATRTPGAQLAHRVELEMLARGGRLHAAFGGDTCSVYLSERRFALLCALAQPSGAYAPGEPIPDDEVLKRVWPRMDHKTRVDLNVLIKRVRDVFESAGVPTDFVSRGESGASTVLAVRPDAEVVVR